MNTNSHKANIPNPALEPFSAFIGEWKTEGTHPLLPGTIFHGRASFEWIEGGAYLIWRSGFDEPGIPTGFAIIGSDDAVGAFFMLYFDERSVSRKYDVSINDNTWKWWRNAPGFSQRYTFILSGDKLAINGRGELSKDGVTWEKDLELIYTRVK